MYILKQHQTYPPVSHFLVTIILLFVFYGFDFLDFTYKWYCTVLVFLCPNYLT